MLPRLFSSCLIITSTTTATISLVVEVVIICTTCLFIISSPAPSLANGSVDAIVEPPAVSPKNICQSTLYPSYCKSILPKSCRPGSLYDYGRCSVERSLSTSHKFLSLVNAYLLGGRSRSALSAPTIRALEDCRSLAGLNIDFLSNSARTVDTAANTTLPMVQADDLQTLLSAILTNQQTCMDGLRGTPEAWRVARGLSASLDSGSKLYSVSLALVTKGWVPKKKAALPRQHRNHRGFRNGRLPLKMATHTQNLFERVSGRKLRIQQEPLMDHGDQVLVSDIAVVSRDCRGNFTTINDAVAAAPNNSDGTDGFFMIYVTAGIYQEYVSVPKNKRFLMMVGDGINHTILTGNRSVDDGWTTYNSATFAVVAPMFVAVNMTFRNTAGAIKHQAVAVRNGADWSTFYSCSFEAYQDTLYTHSLRQFYRECDVYGTVDFIFGNAAVVFQNCNLYARLPMSGQFNAVTAQGRMDPNQNTGTSIHNCTIRPAADLAAVSHPCNPGTLIKSYLGRPWKQYSRTVVMQSYVHSFIDPSGWTPWSGAFALNTSFYGEFNNTGPGSTTANRVSWPGYHVINATDAAKFTASFFLLANAWLPQTGVPYHAGFA